MALTERMEYVNQIQQGTNKIVRVRVTPGWFGRTFLRQKQRVVEYRQSGSLWWDGTKLVPAGVERKLDAMLREFRNNRVGQS